MERRTQAERSAATQQILCDAAIELLIERGWAATTAVAVCERAGVTRGALIHHYPNLAALLASALESLYADLTSGPRDRSSLAATIEGMWSTVADRRFKAAFEAWSAAGNDPELASEIGPAIDRFSRLVSHEDPSGDRPRRDPDTAAFLYTAREAMLGLALGRATNGGEPLAHEATVLNRLRSEAAALDARAA